MRIRFVPCHSIPRNRWVLYIVLAAGLLVPVAAGHAQVPDPAGLPSLFEPANLQWALATGSHQYTIPVVDGDYLYIGTDDKELNHPVAKPTGGGLLRCLDKSTGALVWQLPIPRYMRGKVAPFHFNHWKCGVCSSPALAGERLIIVGPRGDVLCLDRNGQKDGNDGPFLDESTYLSEGNRPDYHLTGTDADILWQFDMIEELGVVPHDICGSSPVVGGDYVYVCTSNGVDHTHRSVANPAAPSLIALDLATGRLAAVDGQPIGPAILHGQWSSPVIGTFDGQKRVLFGAGDGRLYAFELLAASPEPKERRHLKRVWVHDCCPPDYRERDGTAIPYGRWNHNSPEGPSEIIGTPAISQERVYVAIGQSPRHGQGKGMLSCLDGRTGNVLWESRSVGRTLCTAAIDRGLVYIADYHGLLHCLDALTGEHLWQHDLGGGVWSASPMVDGDRVLISNENNRLWSFRTGRRKEVLAQSRVRSMAITPSVHNGWLFFPTQRRLFAICPAP